MKGDGSLAAAMVLAAGRGRRMRPLSDILPKPALPVLDRPLVDWAVRQAATGRPPVVTVNTWHLADRMEQVLRRLHAAVPLRISREAELMDTAGGLALARDRGLLGESGPVLVLNGDCLYGLELGPLVEQHARNRHAVTLALLPHLDPERWARVELAPDGRVTTIRPPATPGRSEVPFLYPGAMIVSRRALDSLETSPGDIARRLWGPAMRRGELGGVVVGGHWTEIGTPQAYRRAVLSRAGPRGWLAPGARVDPTASIGEVVIGPDVVIEEGAVVAASVVTDGAVVRRYARVVESVLVGRVEAAAEDRVVGSVRAGPPVW